MCIVMCCCVFTKLSVSLSLSVWFLLSARPLKDVVQRAALHVLREWATCAGADYVIRIATVSMYMYMYTCMYIYIYIICIYIYTYIYIYIYILLIHICI